MLKPKVYIKESNIVREVEIINFHEKIVDVSINDNTDFISNIISQIPEFFATEQFDFDEVEFMENTGMKDKNGKYIYEGDIVTVNGTWDCIIEYNQSSCAFVLKSIDSRWSTGYFSNYEDIEEMLEVIGNIYENKELLEIDKTNQKADI